MTYGTTVIAVPPGESIREQLEIRELSQKEFALRMCMSEKHISNLINGKVELTPPTAQKLESVLGYPRGSGQILKPSIVKILRRHRRKLKWRMMSKHQKSFHMQE